MSDKVFVAGPGRIFCFGSNLAGKHGAGAAKYAREHCGAIYGHGEGLQGTSYAIPTKDGKLRTLPLTSIRQYVENFLAFARVCLKSFPDMRFFVSRIGCGLAGYSDEDIAPMFKDAPDNCELPEGWR